MSRYTCPAKRAPVASPTRMVADSPAGASTRVQADTTNQQPPAINRASGLVTAQPRLASCTDPCSSPGSITLPAPTLDTQQGSSSTVSIQSSQHHPATSHPGNSSRTASSQSSQNDQTALQTPSSHQPAANPVAEPRPTLQSGGSPATAPASLASANHSSQFPGWFQPSLAPAQPSRPAAPAHPSRPAGPAQLSKPAVPAQPSEPAAPAQPSGPAVLAQPSTVEETPIQHLRFIPSLSQHCLGVVGVYICEYVQALAFQVELLSSDQKSTLLAIARRRGTLCDKVLQTLSDRSCRCLDLSFMKRQMLTVEGCLLAIRRMAGIQVLDISGSPELGTAKTLAALASHCPMVKVLRCGGSSLCDRQLVTSLPPVLPALLRPAVTDTSSWEDAFPSDTTNEDSVQGSFQESIPGSVQGSLQGSPTFQHLQCVVWPTAPAALQHQATHRCPRLQFNPSYSNASATPFSNPPPQQPPLLSLRPSPSPDQDRFFSFLDPMTACDQVYVAGLPESVWAGSRASPGGAMRTPFARAVHPGLRTHGFIISTPGRQAASVSTPGFPAPASQAIEGSGIGEELDEDHDGWVPISVRFRQAYIDQAVRIRKEVTKATHQAELRQLKASPALAAVARWLDDY